MPDDQYRTEAFLGDPASYGLVEPVERLETHISVVFLAGRRACKLKKALKLPYLDFSTAAFREQACIEEVELNKQTAPDLYIGVRRITANDLDMLSFDGTGALVDAVVEMERFEQDHLFDCMAQSGRLTADIMTQTARMIAAYHHAAPVVSKGSGAANIASVLDINDAGFATSKVFGSAEVEALSLALRAQLARHARLLDRRALSGKVRRCHGDLHLRNICMWKGAPCLFDCIEFNPSIAGIDVLYDLAFLLMDLWHRGLADYANLVMNRYLDEADEEDGFCLLPFFMAIRAAVRAHVTATQAEEPDQDTATLKRQARSYFDLASSLLIHSCPRLVAIGGFSGSGKSIVADRLAVELGSPPGARVLESDRLRKALFRVSAEARLPAKAYRTEVSRKVYREMARRAQSILQKGECVVVDAVFDEPSNRQLIE